MSCRQLRLTQLIFLSAAVSCLITSPLTAGLSSLSGFVYVDDDFDGICDIVTEWVVPDIEILLTRIDELAEPVTTVTDELGYYEFKDLDAGIYAITQAVIPDGYLNVLPCVGVLWDIESGLPTATNVGEPVLYDQENGIMPQIAQIEVPELATRGENYNFGQVWLGKAWYLTGGDDPETPPGANPPVPEPSSAALLAILGLMVHGRRRR